MSLNPRFLCLVTLLGLAFTPSMLAAQAHKAVPPSKGRANVQNQGKSQRAHEKGDCEALDNKEKQLLDQQKQLIAQANQKYEEQKALVLQASRIEGQRGSEERSIRKGANNGPISGELKSQEGERVSLERQAKEKAAQRADLMHQADALGKEREEVARQHNSECGSRRGVKQQTR